MNVDEIFNAHILVGKLSKLNNSQQSIATLSHWCIFHMKKAKQIVEIWERQFLCSPKDQRISFLYLANDILQNSRRKGLEFVCEFWRVLPCAVKDVVHNGDEFARNAALRMVDIWEQRRVFGSRGQTLKQDVLGNRNVNSKNITYKLKPPAGGDMLEKLMSGYDQVNDVVPIHEDAIFGKCTAAINFIEKLEKESVPEFNLGNVGGPGVVEELRGHHGFLRNSIEQLKLSESSRAILISHLREAIREQESKIEKIHSQLQIAQPRFQQVDQLLTGKTVPPLPDQQHKEASPPPPPPPSFSEIPPPPDYSPTPDPAPPTAAETLPTQTLTYIPSAAALPTNDGRLSDSNKRPRLDNCGLISVPCYMPQLPPPPPPPPFPHPDSYLPPPPPPPPLPISISPIPPPLPASPFTYGPAVPYPMMGMPPYPGPPIPYNFQGPDNVATLYGQQQLPLPPPPPPLPMISAPPPPPMPRR